MAKPPKKPKPEDIELEPDAWPRFERYIKEVTKAGPQHRTARQLPKSEFRSNEQAKSKTKGRKKQRRNPT